MDWSCRLKCALAYDPAHSLCGPLRPRPETDQHCIHKYQPEVKPCVRVFKQLQSDVVSSRALSTGHRMAQQHCACEVHQGLERLAMCLQPVAGHRCARQLPGATQRRHADGSCKRVRSRDSPCRCDDINDPAAHHGRPVADSSSFSKTCWQPKVLVRLTTGVQPIRQPVRAADPRNSASELRHHGAERELRSVEHQRRDGSGQCQHKFRSALLR